MKRARHDADEQDAFSRRARRLLSWRPGELKAIKARANRRERRHELDDIERPGSDDQWSEWRNQLREDVEGS